MSNINTILIAVFAGILTTTFLSFCKYFFEKILLPWYLEKTYKGIDLNGNWQAKIDNLFTFSLELKQKAYKISGILTIFKGTDDVRPSSHYVEGEVWEGHMSLISRTIDKKQLSFGNLLLKAESGKLLRGIYTARRFGATTAESVGIKSIELDFKRDV